VSNTGVEELADAITDISPVLGTLIGRPDIPAPGA